MNHIILILGADRLVQVVSFTNRNSRHDLVRVPVARSPIKGISIFDNLVESSADLFESCGLVESVSKSDIHIVEFESSKSFFDILFDVFSAESRLRIDEGVRTGKYFG